MEVKNASKTNEQDWFQKVPQALVLFGRETQSDFWRVEAVSPAVCRWIGLPSSSLEGLTDIQFLRQAGAEFPDLHWFHHNLEKIEPIELKRLSCQLCKLVQFEGRLLVELKNNSEQTKLLTTSLKSILKHYQIDGNIFLFDKKGRLYFESNHQQPSSSVENYVDERVSMTTAELVYKIIADQDDRQPTSFRNEQISLFQVDDNLFWLEEYRAKRQPERKRLASSQFPVPLTSITDSLASGFFVLDAHLQIVAVSDGAQKVFKVSKEELTSLPVSSLFIGRKEVNHLSIEEVIRREHQGLELSLFFATGSNGTRIPVQVRWEQLSEPPEKYYVLAFDTNVGYRATEKTISQLAHNDLLTGLANRQKFCTQLEVAISKALADKGQFAILNIDIDRFKRINDGFGWASGDIIIKTVSQRLRACLESRSRIARSGDDQFLVYLPCKNHMEDSIRSAKKILEAIEAPIEINHQEVMITASVGIAVYPFDGDDPHTLLRNSDTALSKAKELGPGVYQFFTDELFGASLRRLTLESNLRKALSRQEFYLCYQPIFDVRHNKPATLEALLRWRHPIEGDIQPAEFIPIAEESGLILDIGRWVMSKSASDLRQLHDEGFHQLNVAINLSARQFEDPSLITDIKKAVVEAGLAAGRLEIEITESMIMGYGGASIARLKELRELGASLIIDDFGTGYSSLSYLKRLPIHALKIDRSFVFDIDTDENSRAIANAIVALANALELEVVAEGVETREHKERLIELSCSKMQGYFFCKPLPLDELRLFLKTSEHQPYYESSTWQEET